MEKCIDQYIRSKLSNRELLHKLQFAYQIGKSSVSVQKCLIGSIENTLEIKEMVLSVFIIIDGDFDNTI